jgi:hypothetical protein
MALAATRGIPESRPTPDVLKWLAARACSCSVVESPGCVGTGTIGGTRHHPAGSPRRVIDPESGLDGVRNIGIRGGEITAISDMPLVGEVKVDASGLVVAPEP